MKILDAKAAVDKEWKKLETIPALDLEKKARARRRLLWKHKESKRKSTFLHWWTHVTLKNAELEPKLQKYKGRVVLRWDIVKDDSGACAVFTEQGSSASQMTAAKIMDVIARLPDCDGQAADSVPAYTQVKLEDAPRFLKIPKSECPDVWIRLPRYKWPTSLGKIEEPVVLLERNLYGHPLTGLLWERQFEEALLELGWEKIPNWECMFVHRKQGLFLSVYVDDIKMAGKKQNLDPMWKKLWKIWTLTNPHHFWTMSTWDALNVNANRMKQSLMQTGKCRITNFCWSNRKITGVAKKLTHKQ